MSACLLCLVGYNLDSSGTESMCELKTEHQPDTDNLTPTTKISRATLDEMLKYTLLIGSLSAEKAGIKPQNGDVRVNAFPGLEIHDVTLYALSDVEIDLIDWAFVLYKKLGLATEQIPSPERLAGSPNKSCK